MIFFAPMGPHVREGEGATQKIWPGSMQQFAINLSLWTTDGRTDDGRMTDACAITVALLTKSSRAKNIATYVSEPISSLVNKSLVTGQVLSCL